MATAVLKNVKVIISDGHSPASQPVIKCLTTVIATNLATEVKSRLMSSILKWMDEVLDWCLKALQKVQGQVIKLISCSTQLVEHESLNGHKCILKWSES